MNYFSCCYSSRATPEHYLPTIRYDFPSFFRPFILFLVKFFFIVIIIIYNCDHCRLFLTSNFSSSKDYGKTIRQLNVHWNSIDKSQIVFMFILKQIIQREHKKFSLNLSLAFRFVIETKHSDFDTNKKKNRNHIENKSKTKTSNQV